MAMAPPKPCRWPGCPELVPRGTRHCTEHAKQNDRVRDVGRASAHDRGYGAPWRKARLAFLRRNPLCKACRDAGRVEPASEVDHVVPHRGDARLFWGVTNWQPLCKPCHSRKTQAEVTARRRGL